MLFERRPDRFLFGVFWQGDGAATGQGGAPSGGSTGDAGGDAATAAANAAGVGNVGPGADANAAAVGGVTGQQGFQGFTGFGGSAGDTGVGFGVSNAGAPPGSGVVGGGNVSFGGAGNAGGGVVGGTGGGGVGGGIGGGAGASTGGNAGGVAGGGFGQQMGTPVQNVGGATLGLGDEGVLHGLANAAPAGTVTSSPLAYTTGLTPGQIASMNSELSRLSGSSATMGTPADQSLSDLARGLATSTTFGPSAATTTANAQRGINATLAGLAQALGLVNATAPNPAIALPGLGPNNFGLNNLGTEGPMGPAGELAANAPGLANMANVSTAALSPAFGPPAPTPAQTNLSNTMRAQSNSPNDAATTVAQAIANQSPAQQNDTIAQAIAIARQSMTPQNYESFLVSLISQVSSGYNEGETPTSPFGLNDASNAVTGPTGYPGIPGSAAVLGAPGTANAPALGQQPGAPQGI